MFKMFRVDKIDKNVIYELSKNARLSYKQIARNINSKKETVAYHINKLIAEGIITKFVPVFSLSRLGIFSSKIYLRLSGLNKEKEEKMYRYLLSNKKIVWVAKSVGRWDLLLGVYATNILDFSKIKEEILSKLSDNIVDYDITHIEDGLVFNRDYLSDKNVDYRKEFIFGGCAGKEKLKEIEFKIIQHIKNNGRFNILDIANHLRIDPKTFINKIKELQKRGILQGFTLFLNLKKIGFQLYKLCVYLQNHNEKKIKNLISFLKNNRQTIHLIKSLGSWELEIEIESGDSKEIYDYIAELKNTFPNMIKQVDLAIVTEELKLEFFPEKL